MSTIDKILSKIDYLPPFPLTVTKALQLLKNPDVSPNTLAEVVKFDQAVASNILRICNSSYTGLSTPITNLQQGIVFVGTKELRRIIILSGTRQYFEKRKPGYEAEKGELWKHTLAVTVIGEKLNEITNETDRDEVFLANLLHDIGKLILSDYVMDAHQEITNMVEQQEVNFIDAEKSIIGIDHTEVGCKILEMWKFSEDIITAVKNHHLPHKEDDSMLDKIVRLSNILAIIMGYETSLDKLSHPDIPEICKLYNIKRTTLDKLMADSLEELQEIEQCYGIS